MKYTRPVIARAALLAVLIFYLFAGAAAMFAQSTGPEAPTTSAANIPPPSPPPSSTTSSSSTSKDNASAAKPAGQLHGLVGSLKFEGSSSSDGQIMDINSSSGYNFNKWFGVDLGMPFYFVRSSSSTTTTNPNLSASGAGLGNLYMDARVNFDNPVANFGSIITGNAPTGSQDKGHSTGQWTWDWSNNFEHAFGPVSPYANVGLGNSVTDMRRFKRPFTTLGHEAHFEAGLNFDIWGPFSASASLYDVLPWGPQTVFSRIVRRKTGTIPGTAKPNRPFEKVSVVVGGPELVRDNGYGASFSYTPKSWIVFEIGYSHSVHLALNTITWGVTFNLRDALHHGQNQ
jgi:hypothetical protein